MWVPWASNLSVLSHNAAPGGERPQPYLAGGKPERYPTVEQSARGHSAAKAPGPHLCASIPLASSVRSIAYALTVRLLQDKGREGLLCHHGSLKFPTCTCAQCRGRTAYTFQARLQTQGLLSL